MDRNRVDKLLVTRMGPRGRGCRTTAKGERLSPAAGLRLTVVIGVVGSASSG